MPLSKRCFSLSPAFSRCLRVAFFTVLGILSALLAVLTVHRGVLPIVAWFFPQFDNIFYDLAVFGAYRTHSYVTSDIPAPDGIFVQWSDRCDDGNVLIAPNGKSVTNPGPVILDAQGETIWMSDEYDVATNVQIQQYNGEDYLTFWAGHKDGSLGQGHSYMLDSKYNIAYKIRPVGQGLESDLHEFQLTKDGTALITIYNTTTLDLSPLGWFHGKQDYISDCVFQEIDIATGALLFQWRAQDHFKPQDTHYFHPFAGYTKSIPYDFYHTNSIDKDSKGNFLISSRHFHHLAYINGTSGETIWILGGGEGYNQFTDLSDGVATGFKWQHHARWVSEEEGIISLMDNGNAGPLHVDAPYSKGLLIKLDLEHYTASIVQKYVSLNRAQSASQGSLQPLANGNMLVGWGSAGAWTEYAPDGELLCEAHFAASWSFWWERAKNYRTFKHHGWVGRPDYPPYAKMQDGRIYVSWNGATEVKHWRLEAMRADASTYESIEVSPKTKFEVSFAVPKDGEDAKYRVAALDSSRQVLEYSESVERERTGVSTFTIITVALMVVGLMCATFHLLRRRARRKDGRLLAWEAPYKFFRSDYQYSKL